MRQPLEEQQLSAGVEDASFVGEMIADRYRVIRVIGRGGMGTVYECEHVQLKKRVALKVLANEVRQDPQSASRFLKEARAAAQIGHPNIVDIFDLGELPTGGTFIAMALLEGNDLDQELKRNGPMSFSRARTIIGQVCRALAAAHALGITHRDMKPGNVFLARDSEGAEHVKVLDFGIAQVNDGDADAVALTQTGTILGTPAFMSPEQGRGTGLDHRSDIYSVGCILYMQLTGKLVFEGPTVMAVIARHMVEDPVPPSQRAPDAHIPPELDAVVLRALAKEPADRYQTMKELWLALESLNADPETWPEATSGRFGSVRDLSTLVPPDETPPTASDTAALPQVSHRWSPAAIAALGLLAAGALGIALWPRAPGPPAPVAVAEDVALEVTADRPEAKVTIRGVTYPLPLHTRLSRSGNAEMIEVSAPGVPPWRSWVTLDRDRGVTVALAAAAGTPPTEVPALAATHRPSAHPKRPVDTPDAPLAVPAAVEAHAVAPPAVVPAPVVAPAGVPPNPVATPPKPVAPAPPLVLGSQVMQRLVHAHQGAIDSCIAEDPSASGKLAYKLTIAADGKVLSAQIIEAARRYPAIEYCIAHAAPQWTLAPAPGRPAEGRAVVELD